LAQRKAPSKTKKVIADLLMLLKSKKSSVRKAAVEALGKMGPKAQKAIPALIKVLDDKDPDVSAAAVESLGKMKSLDKRVVYALIKALKRNEYLTRLKVIETLGKMGTKAKPAIPVLVKAYQDGFAGVGQWERRHPALLIGIIYALFQIDWSHKEVYPILLKALKMKKW